MKQTKHTPGPWKVDKATSTGTLIFAPSNQLVGHAIERGGSDGANAHLIASAPELLEACKLLYKAWEELIPCLKNSAVQDYGLVLTTAPLAARAAIAKAEGKEN